MKVGLSALYRLNKEAALLGRAAAEFYQLNVFNSLNNSAYYLVRARAEYVSLGAGEIILRQTAYGFEQMRAQLVVKMLRRQSLRTRREADPHIASKVVSVASGSVDDQAVV
jgi:hypothetical protein